MEPVRVQQHPDGIAEVILCNPERHNAVSEVLMLNLIRIGRELRRDRNLRAVILHAEGPSFCSGLDIPSFMKQPRSMVLNFLRPFWRSTNNFQEVAWVWRRLPVPVIAVLHGRCYGAGLQIALAADFRLATADCELSILEAKWGLVPDMSGTVTLRELLPMDLAKRLTMTGELFTADVGQDMGLVTSVHADPLQAARDLAAQLVTRSPDSVAATKLLFQRAWPASAAVAFCWERWYQLRLLLGRNQRVAVARATGRGSSSFLPRRVQR